MMGMVSWPKRQYLHTTASIATVAKVKDIEAKIWGNVEWKVELNQNILDVYRFSQAFITNILETANHI